MSMENDILNYIRTSHINIRYKLHFNQVCRKFKIKPACLRKILRDNNFSLKVKGSKKEPIKWDEQKITELKGLVESGFNIPKLAKHYSLSKQRLSQVLAKYQIQRYRVPKKERKIPIKFLDKPVNEQWLQLTIMQKRSRYQSTLVIEDLLPLPTHCPVLGLELDYGRKNNRALDNSPSVDKFDPSKGYVKGNVAIISLRANRIKNYGSMEEHRLIYEWMQFKLKP